MIALVAALSENRVIGKDGKMPWHLPADLIHFRRLTRGHVIVMGRKTFESIGEPLRGRINVVLTRNAGFAAPGCEVVHSIAPVLAYDQQVFVIGGSEIYRLFLPHADHLHLTRIHAEFAGDSFFPDVDLTEWELVSSIHRPQDERNPYDCTFEVYQRAGGAGDQGES